MADSELIRILRNISILLEIKGENPFKAKAYSNAAEIIEQRDIDIASEVRNGTISQINGFGKALQEKISDYILNGKMQYYERLKSELPESLIDITTISGIGPKKAKALYEILGISDLDELEEACIENKVSSLKGFTPKSVEMIINGIQHKKASKGRFVQDKIRQEVFRIDTLLRSDESIKCAAFAGDYRRFSETITKLELLIAADKPVNDSSLAMNLNQSGIELDIIQVPEDGFYWQLHRLTGNGNYVSSFEELLKSKGIEFDERGIIQDAAYLYIGSEEDIYKIAGLQYVAPELRESPKILEKASEYRIPEIVKDSDLKGMLHCHSNWSDGKNSIKDMALASKSLGFEYFAICDHSRAAAYTNGLSIERVLAQHKEIDELNSSGLGIRILKGIESDILSDGSLDYPEEILEQFDLVVASVHSSFKMSKLEMTRRVIYALRSPYTTILGHPTGRLLLARPPYEIDIKEIIDVAASEGKIIEINANPYRLDLAWEELEYAKSRGLKIAINPDSHRTDTLSDVFIGVKAARKGCLEASDIVNCLNYDEFTNFLSTLK